MGSSFSKRIRDIFIKFVFLNGMFSSILFRRMVLTILTIVIIFSAVILYFSVYLIKETVYQLEENSSKAILENIYHLISSEHKSSETFWKLKIASHKKHLHNITVMQDQFIRSNYKKLISQNYSKEDAKKKIISDIGSLKYASNNFWIVSKDYKMEFNSNSSLIDKDSSKLKDAYGSFLFKEIVDRTVKSGENYSTFSQQKKNDIMPLERYYYSRYYPELEWIIGTDVSMEEIDKEVLEREKMMIERLQSIISEIKVSHSGYVFIFDDYLKIITHPDKEIRKRGLSGVKNNLTGKPLGMELIELSKSDNPQMEFVWEQDGKIADDKIQITRVKLSEEMGWYIAIAMDKDELSNSADKLTSIMVTMVITMLFFLNLFGILFLKRILDPIKELSDITLKARDGDLNVRCEIESDNEIGILASTFNAMIEQIKDNIANLDRKVAERTMELDEKNENLQIEILIREHAEKEVQKMNEKLEDMVEERTNELQKSLDALKKAQDQLVQSEKMASLGGLVAGVAHEINTPVGIGVTEASFLKEKTETLDKAVKEGKLKKSDLDQFLDKAVGSTNNILTNLHRAADLIASFKQVASDQTCSERRPFNIKEYIDETLVSLQAKFKRTNHKIIINCPDDIVLNSYPGAFSQIITNLLMNSLIHGFEHIDSGEIVIDVMVRGKEFVFCYKDNGKGMTKEQAKNIFEPFFTTKRGQGGTGLGMHIVYNIVTQTLGGVIELTLPNDKGIAFYIKMDAEEILDE